MSKIPQEAIEALVSAAKNAVTNKQSHYKARNGRLVTIEGDDGERVWLVSLEDMSDIEQALEAADAAGAQGAEVEPAAWQWRWKNNSCPWHQGRVPNWVKEAGDAVEERPLYTAPPAPQPTDETCPCCGGSGHYGDAAMRAINGDIPPTERENVLEEIAAERARQITGEGWTPEHDDHHDSGEMAEAAAGYALKSTGTYGNPKYPPNVWPWDIGWWKPTTPRRDLVKAAALLVAEIERLDRAALAGGEA